MLRRIIHRTEAGLAIGDSEISACTISVFAWRRREISRATVTYRPDGLVAALKEVLEASPLGLEPARTHVSIGLPPIRLFCSTRSVTEKQLNDPPQTLLREMVQTTTLVVDDMAVDLVKHTVKKRTLASLGSCREKYLSGILAALDTCGVHPKRAEPTACALVRLASRMHRPRRKAKCLLRVFLGNLEGIAVLVTRDDVPITWRPFELPPGGELAAILAAVVSVRGRVAQSGLDGDIDALMIHGRPELATIEELRADASLAGLELVRKDGPALDNPNVALGLTTVSRSPVDSLNLMRSRLGKPKLLEIFPWGEAVIAAIFLLAATLFFTYRLKSQLSIDAAAVAEDSKYKWAAKLPSEKLATEKKQLEEKIETVRSFLASKIFWTSYARSLAGRLTPDISIVSINGAFELDSPGAKTRPKRSLVIRFNAPIPQTGTLPPEIDALLLSLRAAPLLKKDFPEVNLADLRWIPGTGKAPAMANFSVVCQPAKAAASKTPGEATKKTKGR